MDIIIILVVILVICCCCIASGGGGYYYYTNNMIPAPAPAPASDSSASAPASDSSGSAPASDSSATAPAPVSTTPAPVSTTPAPKKPGPRIVCGVNSSDAIFCANKNLTTKPNWIELPGSGRNVSVNNNGSIHLTNSGEGIWYKPDTTNQHNWNKLTGGLWQLSSNSGFMCGVNKSGEPHCADQALTSSPNWVHKPGKLHNMSVNADGSVYAVTGSAQALIYYMPDYRTNQRILLPGPRLRQISSKDAIVCGVNESGNAFCADKDITSRPNWRKLPESQKLHWITVNGDGSLFGTNFGGQILYKANYNDDNDWNILPGGLKQISSI